MVNKSLCVEESPSKNLGNPKKILVIRQHNQFGDLLTSVSLFRAIKGKYPDSHLTLVASPENYYAVTKNKYIDRLFVFDKKKLINPSYHISLRKILRDNYNLAVVPATVAISKTSCILAGFSDAKIKIGPASLNGKKNELACLFHHRIKLDWRIYPDIHISDFGQDILRPFGISTRNFKAQITVDEKDEKTAEEFIESFQEREDQLLIGLHIGAGKQPNRWSIQKFLELIDLISQKYNAAFYFTGSKSDKEEIDFVKNKLQREAGFFLDHSIPELAALISSSNLFITNDTGVMHVAGATDTPQISVFGPTNPYNWSPMGPNKYFVKKSDITDDVTVEDVFEICQLILDKTKCTLDGKETHKNEVR